LYWSYHCDLFEKYLQTIVRCKSHFGIGIGKETDSEVEEEETLEDPSTVHIQEEATL
jgi:hypothetical protein